MQSKITSASSIAILCVFLSSCHSVSAESTSYDTPDLNPKVLDIALKAQKVAQKKHQVASNIVTVIDYSLPSTEKRFWTIDTKTHKVLFHDYITHGKGSGKLYATHFSNQSQSRESSLGVFSTGKPYYGKHGLSLRLNGLEAGINDKAYRRNVVIHPAYYADGRFAKQYGYLGRSWGCPAVSPTLSKKLINTIKDGSLVVAYYPDKNWLSHSEYLNTVT